MKRVVLIHFNPEEAPERLDRLRRAGCVAEYFDVKQDRLMRGIRANPPDAIAIDLARLPSHGKEVGLALRGYASTRNVPLVYIEGDPGKSAAVRSALPDATFTTWERAARDIDALGGVVAPAAGGKAGYSGTPLSKKLGIKPGSKVMTMAAPDWFEGTLEAMAEGAEIVRAGRADVTIVFTSTQSELEARLAKAIRQADEKTRIWVAWPKKTSGVLSDLNENAVRDFGLGLGWVDYKVCAIDRTWSGLLFAPRKPTAR